MRGAVFAMMDGALVQWRAVHTPARAYDAEGCVHARGAAGAQRRDPVMDGAIDLSDLIEPSDAEGAVDLTNVLSGGEEEVDLTGLVTEEAKEVEEDAIDLTGLVTEEAGAEEEDAVDLTGLVTEEAGAEEEDAVDLSEVVNASRQPEALDDQDLADVLANVVTAEPPVKRLRLLKRPPPKVKAAEKELAPPAKKTRTPSATKAAPRRRAVVEGAVKRARRAAGEVRRRRVATKASSTHAKPRPEANDEGDEEEEEEDGLDVLEGEMQRAVQREAKKRSRVLPMTQLPDSVANDPVVASYLATTAADRAGMVAAAAAIRTGARPPAESVLGPPVTYPDLVGRAAPQRGSLHQLVDDILTAIVNAAADAEPARRADTGPRLLTGWDAVQHYLISDEARPSPADASIVLQPRPCSAGDNCFAFKHLVRSCGVSPHTEGPPSALFRLVGMLPESEMRAFYASGVWPSTRPAGDPPCVICSLVIAVRLALALERLPHTSRPLQGTLVQPVYCDTDERHGFQKHALIECSVGSLALERPVLNVISLYFLRAVHQGIHCLELVPEVLQQPARFCGSDAWASDLDRVGSSLDFHDRVGQSRGASTAPARPVPTPSIL